MITKEISEKYQLSEDATTGLNQFIEESIKPQFASMANENAEKIIEGALKGFVSVTGIQREKGQKGADYIEKASSQFLKSKEESLKLKETELEEKIKNLGDDATKQELEKYKNQLQSVHKQLEEYEPLKIKASQFDEVAPKYDNLKKQIAFNSVKPQFDEKFPKELIDLFWGNKMAEITEKNDIDVDENGNAIYKEKGNEFATYKPLLDLIKKDVKLAEYISKDTVKGSGAGQQKPKSIEGIPVAIPETATKEEAQKLIKEYLVNDLKLNPITSAYSDKYTELYISYQRKTAK